MNRNRIVSCAALALLILPGWVRAQDLHEMWVDNTPALTPLPKIDHAVAIGYRDQRVYVVGPSTCLTPTEITIGHHNAQRFLIARYTPEGTVDAFAFFPGRNPGVDQDYVPVAMAIDTESDPATDAGDARIFVTGYYPGVGGTRDCMTVAFNGGLTAVWSRSFNYQPPGVPAFAGDDIPVSISLNANPGASRVAVAVTSAGYPSGTHVHLLVYNRDTGTDIGNLNDLYRASGGYDSAVGAKFYSQTQLILSANWNPAATNPSITAWRFEEITPNTPLEHYEETAVKSFVPNSALCTAARANAMAIASVPDHDNIPVYLCGYYIGRPPEDKDVLLVKFDFGSTPDPTWAATHPSTGEDDGIAMDANGGKYSPEDIPIFVPVTGWHTDGSGARRARTILFKDTIRSPTAPTGTTAPDLWWVSTNSLGGDDRGLAVSLVDPYQSPFNDHEHWRIYTTEQRWNGANFDWRTTQYYSGSQDTVSPRAPHSEIFLVGAANGNDVPAALKHVILPDGFRYVFVTGGFWSGANYDDFVTVKYRDDAP